MIVQTIMMRVWDRDGVGFREMFLYRGGRIMEVLVEGWFSGTAPSGELSDVVIASGLNLDADRIEFEATDVEWGGEFLVIEGFLDDQPISVEVPLTVQPESLPYVHHSKDLPTKPVSLLPILAIGGALVVLGIVIARRKGR